MMIKGDAAQAPGSQSVIVILTQAVEGMPLTQPIELPKEPRAMIFDAEWYRKKYPDVAAAGIDPVQHFLEYGAGEGRDPNPFFNTRHYRTKYSDVANCNMNPFLHYLFYGIREGREPQPDQEEIIERSGVMVVADLSDAALSTRALTPEKKVDGLSKAKETHISSAKARKVQSAHQPGNEPPD